MDDGAYLYVSALGVNNKGLKEAQGGGGGWRKYGIYSNYGNCNSNT